MAEVRIKATKRADTGKGPARRARAAGRVPAVLYGRGLEPLSIEVDRRDLVKALRTEAGMNVLLDIELDGKTTLALTRELQQDPVRRDLLHADFVKVDRTQEIDVEVPIHVVGESPGVKEGGVLEHPLFQVHVRCRATDVPEFVEADVSRLGIGDSLRVSDLAEGRNFHILDDPESVVVSNVAPVSEEELEAMVAGVTEPQPAEEPEVTAEKAPAEPEGGDTAVA